MNRPPLRCAISDRNAGGNGTLIDQAAQLAADGVELLQLREKDLSVAELAFLARTLLHILRGSQTKLLINGRADVALAVGAAGVHLTAQPEELTPGQVHHLYAQAGQPAPRITVSCHTLEDVTRLQGEPVSAILFGPVFEKCVGGECVTEGIGLALLAQACALAEPIPVLALGGVTEANFSHCLLAGAAGFAGIRLFQRA